MIEQGSFGRALVNLNRLRLRRLFGEDAAPTRERRSRGNVLTWMATQLPRSVTRDDASLDYLDGAVSVVGARVDEHVLDRLSALCVAAETLASDSQFARLGQTSRDFAEIARSVELSRPYLAAVLTGFATALARDQLVAVVELERRLGLAPDETPRTRIARDVVQLADVVLANSFRTWLREGTTAGLERARAIAVERQLGEMHSLAALLLTYARAANASDVRLVAPEFEPSFRSGSLRQYLERRGITSLFPSQYRALERGVLAEGSRLVALPTSSGKTFLAELRIAAELHRRPNARVIYLAPYRLLARQVEGELRKGLGKLSREVADLGSDFDISVSELLAAGGKMPDVAVMTPERLDALTRLAVSAREGAELAKHFLDSVSLLVFDEFHLVGRPSRGPRFELLVARLRLQFPQMQVLGLSGVIGGTTELAKWLGPAEAVFGGNRPTSAIELVWTTKGEVREKLGARNLKITALNRPPRSTAIDDASRVVLRIERHLSPILVIETTRPWAEGVASRILRADPAAADAWRRGLQDSDLARVAAVADDARITLGDEHPLADLILAGVPYHHAGLPTNLLRGIEGLVERRLVRVLSATTTVAEGSHLPFQLVVIPHLTFEGAERGLEKDLYLNILGRAGRASYAMEGIVLVLASSSPTLRAHVGSVLWSERQVHVAGRLGLSGASPNRLLQLDEQWDMDGQLLAWLGEPGSDVADQSGALAERTLTWLTTPVAQRAQVTRAIDAGFARLESCGLIETGSPYRLTGLGRRARLAGMAPATCLRLGNAVTRRATTDTLLSLHGAKSIDASQAATIAGLLFESLEVMRQGLWFRRTAKTEEEKVSTLIALADERLSWPYQDDLYQSDVRLLQSWLLGSPYADLGGIAPQVGGRGLFGSAAASARTADAAEYFGHLAYPASWAWSAALSMTEALADVLPAWLRTCVRLGVPTETAVELIVSGGLSRAGAVRVAPQLGPSWDEAHETAMALSVADLGELGVSAADRQQYLNWAGREG